MDFQVQQALKAAIAGFQAGQQQHFPTKIVFDAKSSSLFKELAFVFDSEEDFMPKLSKLDGVIEAHTEAAPLSELLFDLLMINFFVADSARFDDDYLNSPEWQQIEDDTIDRGSEVLNLFLYLKECQEEDIEPSLPDYLNEFLLVEDEEFQDEHEIYEEVIAGQGLMDTDYAEIASAARQLPESSGLNLEFYALMSFFLNVLPEKAQIDQFLVNAPDKPLDCAIYFGLIAYNEGLESIPLEIHEPGA